MEFSFRMFGITSALLLATRSIIWYLIQILLKDFENLELARLDICVIGCSMFCVVASESASTFSERHRSGIYVRTTTYYSLRQSISNFIRYLTKFALVHVIVDTALIVVLSTPIRNIQKRGALDFCFY